MAQIFDFNSYSSISSTPLTSSPFEDIFTTREPSMDALQRDLHAQNWFALMSDPTNEALVVMPDWTENVWTEETEVAAVEQMFGVPPENMAFNMQQYNDETVDAVGGINSLYLLSTPAVETIDLVSEEIIDPLAEQMAAILAMPAIEHEPMWEKVPAPMELLMYRRFRQFSIQDPTKQCGACGFKTGKTNDMTRHLRAELNIAAYKCQHAGCGKAFKQKSQLKCHMVTHNPALASRCTHCKAYSGCDSGLSRHMRTHHPDVHVGRVNARKPKEKVAGSRKG